MKRSKPYKDKEQNKIKNAQARFRLYAELNRYLPIEIRNQVFSHQFSAHETIKQTLNHMGVPATKVDLILANGQSISLSYILKNGDYISIYPAFELLDISQINQLRDAPLRNPRFILDVHLGKLAKYLRMLGFDSYYSSQLADSVIIEISRCEHRIILSKDRELLADPQVTHRFRIQSSDPYCQIKAVIKKFDLATKVLPLSRCIICNHQLVKIDKDKIINRLKADTRKYMDEFNFCVHCDKIYWKGSYYQRMYDFCKQLINPDIS